MVEETNESSLKALQERLDIKGIRDIKVFWGDNINNITRDVLEKELISVLNTYLDGCFTPLKPIGDGLLQRKDIFNIGGVPVINMPEGYKITQIFLHNPMQDIALNINPIAHVVMEKSNDQTTEYTLVHDDIGNEYVIPVKKLEDWYMWIDSDDRHTGSILPPYAVLKEGFITFQNYKVER